MILRKRLQAWKSTRQADIELGLKSKPPVN